MHRARGSWPAIVKHLCGTVTAPSWCSIPVKGKKMKIKYFTNNQQIMSYSPGGKGHLGLQMPHFPFPIIACPLSSTFVAHHGTPGVESIKLHVLCRIPL